MIDVNGGQLNDRAMGLLKTVIERQIRYAFLCRVYTAVPVALRLTNST